MTDQPTIPTAEQAFKGPLSRKQVGTFLELECGQAGGIRPWARKHKLDAGFISHVLSGRRDPGPKLLKILKLREIKLYERRP